jgi:hypothetical protein
MQLRIGRDHQPCQLIEQRLAPGCIELGDQLPLKVAHVRYEYLPLHEKAEIVERVVHPL